MICWPFFFLERALESDRVSTMTCSRSTFLRIFHSRNTFKSSSVFRPRGVCGGHYLCTSAKPPGTLPLGTSWSTVEVHLPCLLASRRWSTLVQSSGIVSSHATDVMIAGKRVSVCLSVDLVVVCCLPNVTPSAPCRSAVKVSRSRSSCLSLTSLFPQRVSSLWTTSRS